MEKPSKKGGGTEKRKKIIRVVMIVANLIILLVCIEVFGSWGLLGFVLFILVLALWRLFKQREQVLFVIKSIEMMIFGKYLDRDMWEKGELKARRSGRITCWLLLILSIAAFVYAGYTYYTISFFLSLFLLILFVYKKLSIKIDGLKKE